jgi:amino acid transporter
MINILGVLVMLKTIMILLYICFGINAVFRLIKEFRKPQKKQFLILVDSLILIGAIFLMDSFFI